MGTGETVIPDDWKVVIDGETIQRSLSRIAYEILERDDSSVPIAIVGIRTAGEFLAQRLLKKLQEIDPSKNYAYGVIDITLYRDDLSHSAEQPTIKGTELDFSISGQRIILVDDVLFTGRTVRAALDAIIDFGRPDCVELAVLADRGTENYQFGLIMLGKIFLPRKVNLSVSI